MPKGPAYRACGATTAGRHRTQDAPECGHTRDAAASPTCSGSVASGLISPPEGGLTARHLNEVPGTDTRQQ